MNQTALLASMVASAFWPQPASDTRKELVRAWQDVCSARAKAYEIYATDAPDHKFKLLPQPVLYHSQPVRGNDIGAVYVWVQPEGRPGVIGAIFGFSTSARDGSRTVFHEMHSLAAVPIAARWQGRSESVAPTLQWKPIPNAPLPAGTSKQRLRQMRLLSRQFRGHSIDHKGGRWELRLIPRPLYHYDVQNDDSMLGGSLFAFCQGTDTEIVLAIEAHNAPDGRRWRFACADFSDYGLYMRRDDAEVWSSPTEHMSGLKWTTKFYRIRLPEDNGGPKRRATVLPSPGSE